MRALFLLLGLMAVSPAFAEFNATVVTLPHDEMLSLVKNTAARRAAVNHDAGYDVVQGADGGFYVVVREGGNAFKDAGNITVDKFTDQADVAWDGSRTPVAMGHLDLNKDCALLQDWNVWVLTGASMFSVVRRPGGEYHLTTDNGRTWRTCDEGLCGGDAFEAFKPMLAACGSARF